MAAVLMAPSRGACSNRLLLEPNLEIIGISGTSAGAMSAAILADGLRRGGRSEASRHKCQNRCRGREPKRSQPEDEGRWSEDWR